ncbi:MAG: YitT family protein [Lachnospiraceae bacterium]|nr:YitT family protein [Lachnospiraceae bacterium]
MKKRGLRIIRHLILIAAASIVYAAGVSLFLDPNNLAPGGVTGVSVILNRLSGIETGTLYFLLNVPIVLLGIWKFGWRFIMKTAYAIFMTSAFTNLLSGYDALTDDPLLAALAGGVLMACGVGMIFKTGATTGGMDIIIKIIRQKYRHLKTGFLFQCTDIIIVGISGLVFRDLNIALYALLAVLICGRTLDYVLYGNDEARMIYIITGRPEAIGRKLLQDVEVGVTYFQGKGGWTGEEKQVIFCIVRKQLSPQVEEITKQEDPSAFMIITSASEIYGEGYKDFFADRL